MDRIKQKVSELISRLYGNCQIKWNILQEEPLGPGLLGFHFLPLSMVLVYPSHTELGL